MRPADTETVSTMIELSSRTPFAVGQLRKIYQHPSEPDLLIKVLRPEAVRARCTTPVTCAN